VPARRALPPPACAGALVASLGDELCASGCAGELTAEEILVDAYACVQLLSCLTLSNESATTRASAAPEPRRGAANGVRVQVHSTASPLPRRLNTSTETRRDAEPIFAATIRAFTCFV
jgi:hypothetical protein